MDLVISLLILALVVVVAFYIVDRLELGDIAKIVKMILGVLFLIYLLSMLFGGAPVLFHLGHLT